MSSERQLADGLTKEAARNLLAQRLRYGKLKFIWNPTYKAAKKKTKDELKASIQESTLGPSVQPPKQMNFIKHLAWSTTLNRTRS